VAWCAVSASCHYMHDDKALVKVASRITIAVGLDNPMAELQCTTGQGGCESLVLWLSRITRRECSPPRLTLLRISSGHVEIDGVAWDLFSDCIATESCEYLVTPDDWQDLKKIVLGHGIRAEHAEHAFHLLAD